MSFLITIGVICVGLWLIGAVFSTVLNGVTAARRSKLMAEEEKRRVESCVVRLLSMPTLLIWWAQDGLSAREKVDQAIRAREDKINGDAGQ